MPELRFLKKTEYEIVRALTEAMIPRGGAFDLGAPDVGVADKVDELLHYFPPDFRFGFRMLMRGIQLSSLFSLRFTRFTRMTLEDRVSFLETMEESWFYPRRAIIVALKALVCLVFYSDPKVEAILGYSIGCVK